MKSALLRYSLALLVSSLAVALMLGSHAHIGPAIYPLLLAVVFASAYYGGHGPGLLALLVSVLGAFTGELPSDPPVQRVISPLVFRAVMFGLVSLWVVWLGARLRWASSRVDEMKREHSSSLVQVQSEQKQLESVLDSITDIFMTVDREWRLTYLNRKAERFLNQPREKLVGRYVWEVFPDAAGQAFYQQGMRALQEQSSVEYEEFFPPSNCWFAVRAYPSPKGLAAYFQEITKRKRAEEEFRKLSQVVEQTADSVMITDCDGKIEYVNPAFEQLTGYSSEEVIGQSSKLLRSGRHTPDFYANLWDTILSGNVYRGVMINRRKNGQLFYSQRTITPLRDEHGKVVRFVATDTDITEQKHAEEALRQSEASLAEAQRIARLGSWVLDIATNEIRCSDETYRIFGISPQPSEIGYERFLERIPPDSREQLRRVITAAIKEQVPPQIDFPIVRPDGNERFIHSQGEIICDEAGKPVRLIGTIQDITERKQVELALARANRALRALSESNRAVASEEDEAALLQEVCRIAVEVGGYRFAWIGYADQDAGKSVRPMTKAGYEDGYLKIVRVNWSDSERGRGPVGTALRTGVPYVVRDVRTDPRFLPWRDEALRRGYESILALPLKADGATFGTLAIYAAEPNAFDDEEVRLLWEVARDLAYGICTLRIREERAKAENELEEAREQVLQAEVEKKQFYGAVIGAVTHGKLHLVEASEIPIYGELILDVPLDPSGNYAELRARLREVAAHAGMTAETTGRLLLATGEAVTNAVKHGINGRCTVRVLDDRIIVQVSDQGPGILPQDLPSTLLVPGFSTKVSLGMGYTMMLEFADQIWLATASTGTVVQLENWIRPEEHPDRSLEAMLDRF